MFTLNSFLFDSCIKLYYLLHKIRSPSFNHTRLCWQSGIHCVILGCPGLKMMNLYQLWWILHSWLLNGTVKSFKVSSCYSLIKIAFWKFSDSVGSFISQFVLCSEIHLLTSQWKGSMKWCIYQRYIALKPK